MIDDLVKRLRWADFGTETSERNLMISAAGRIEAQAARIAELEAALSAAAEDIGTWGSQASQYSQEKWDLEGDVKRYIAIAEGKLPYRARHPMETWKDE